MPQFVKVAIVALSLPLAVLFIYPPDTVVAQQTLRAAAVVNDEIVSMLDVEQRLLLSILATGQKDSPQLRQRMLSQVVRNLIDERLQAQEAERLDIEVTEAQVQTAMDDIAKRNNMSPAQFLRLLESRGIMSESMTSQVRAQIVWQALIARRIRPSAQVSQDEIDDAVQRIRANRGSVMWEISEIFLGVDSPSQDEEVRRNAERLLEQLRANADFRLLAREFSQSATAARNGEVGWIRQGQMPEEIDSVVASLRPGQISRPIRTLSGYHIIWLKNQRQIAEGEVTLDLKQVLFALPQNPGTEQRAAAVARAQEIRPRVTGCQDFDSLAEKVGSPGSGNLGRMKLAELPPPVREAVQNLSKGQVSQPVALSAGISLLVVCDREDSDIDRERISQRLSDERLNINVRRFMRDLRRDANVDVRI